MFFLDVGVATKIKFCMSWLKVVLYRILRGTAWHGTALCVAGCGAIRYHTAPDRLNGKTMFSHERLSVALAS